MVVSSTEFHRFCCKYQDFLLQLCVSLPALCHSLPVTLAGCGLDYVDFKSIKTKIYRNILSQGKCALYSVLVCKKEVYRKTLANLMQMLQENRCRIAPN
jgi:hypothetical protein